MATSFSRFEIDAYLGRHIHPVSTRVVIVARDETIARQRLAQMHPWARVVGVQQTPFDLPRRSNTTKTRSE